MRPLSVAMNADSGEKTWLTPPHIIEALGPFDLDPCCPPNMPWQTAAQMVCRPDDGLAVDWTGKRVWLNPPYGREAIPFLRKMAKTSEGGGILLIFARTDTSAWQDWIFPYAYGILFLRGRLRFCRPDGTPGETATAPSALVAYSESDSLRLRSSKIAGTFLHVKSNCPIPVQISFDCDLPAKIERMKIGTFS